MQLPVRRSCYIVVCCFLFFLCTYLNEKKRRQNCAVGTQWKGESGNEILDLVIKMAQLRVEISVHLKKGN